MAGKSEKSILNDILMAVSALSRTLVYRNNTGMAWQGKRMNVPEGQYIRVEQGMVVLKEARPIRFGLEGSGDIMGTSDGAALAIEVKDATGRQADVQSNFERAWAKAGGVYILARSKEEAVDRVLAARADRAVRDVLG